jgi:sugar phosphate isomerase/epimerase
MKRLSTGIRLEHLGLPLRRALQEAERLGVAGVQVDAVGDLAPGTLSQTGRREFRNLLRSHNLELAALGCPLRHGLGEPVNLEARIDHVKKVLNLSYDLGSRTVIVQAGAAPTDPSAPSLLDESLLVLGRHADTVGSVLALETGLESGEALYQFLHRFDMEGLGVSLDPANLLINGFDPIGSTRALGARIRHVQARDARRAGANRTLQEVPLGHGDLDWNEFLAALEEVEYRRWLVVARESGDNRLSDVGAGILFLKQLLG